MAACWVGTQGRAKPRPSTFKPLQGPPLRAPATSHELLESGSGPPEPGEGDSGTGRSGRFELLAARVPGTFSAGISGKSQFEWQRLQLVFWANRNVRLSCRFLACFHRSVSFEVFLAGCETRVGRPSTSLFLGRVWRLLGHFLVILVVHCVRVCFHPRFRATVQFCFFKKLLPPALSASMFYLSGLPCQ